MLRNHALGLSLDQIQALVDFYETTTGRLATCILVDPDNPGPCQRMSGGIADPDYKSPDCPSGYETVVGYLTEFTPRIWDLIDHTPEATCRDGWWLKHRCRQLGLPVLRVPASPWLVRHGIFEVNAYPIALLRERFGTE